MIHRKLNGFSIIELLIIISMVSALLIVSAPTFYGIFKQQFIVYDANYLIQNIRGIQSKAFTEHQFYKVSFNNEIPNYSLSYFESTEWINYDVIKIDDSSLIYNDQLNNSTSLIYGPNGNAYLCSNSAPPEICKTSPINQTESITLKINKKEINIHFLPISGYVSSNISVK